jgi:GntR family transcriptional regulator
MTSVTNVTFSPLYRQIRERLLDGLQAGEWRPGEPIPSETELASRYRVSQGTVRKAIDELAAENLLVRRQGRGTFVASHQEPRAQFRFLRLRPNEGEPVQPVGRILECRRQRAPSEIARLLELKVGEPVVTLRRVLEFDGVPTVLDEIWLPGTQFRGLTAERVKGYSGPLYGLLETEFGMRMIRATERLRAVPAAPEQAGVLGVPEGSPLLLVERVSSTYQDLKVEVRRGYYVTTAHHYFNELS